MAQEATSRLTTQMTTDDTTSTNRSHGGIKPTSTDRARSIHDTPETIPRPASAETYGHGRAGFD